MSDWMGDGWMDTPQTVMTTRAPAVLKKETYQLSNVKLTKKEKNYWDQIYLLIAVFTRPENSERYNIFG